MSSTKFVTIDFDIYYHLVGVFLCQIMFGVFISISVIIIVDLVKSQVTSTQWAHGREEAS